MEDVQTICPHCNHVTKGYPNFWGKICINCNAEIPATYVPTSIEEAQMRKSILQKAVRESIRKKFGT
jgi:hypothetical protein